MPIWARLWPAHSRVVAGMDHALRHSRSETLGRMTSMALSDTGPPGKGSWRGRHYHITQVFQHISYCASVDNFVLKWIMAIIGNGLFDIRFIDVFSEQNWYFYMYQFGIYFITHYYWIGLYLYLHWIMENKYERPALLISHTVRCASPSLHYTALVVPGEAAVPGQRQPDVLDLWDVIYTDGNRLLQLNQGDVIHPEVCKYGHLLRDYYNKKINCTWSIYKIVQKNNKGKSMNKRQRNVIVIFILLCFFYNINYCYQLVILPMHYDLKLPGFISLS